MGFKGLMGAEYVTIIGIALLLLTLSGSTPIGDDGICGNTIIDLGEQCDDGNTQGGDGCDETCNLESTGDCCAVQSTPYCNSQEIYDAVCTIDPFCCSVVWDQSCVDVATTLAYCAIPQSLCGNGVIEPGEECDDWNTQSGDGCSSTCVIEVCGNTIIDPGEECDDGNTQSGDGCSSTCIIETCPSTCSSTKGTCPNGDKIEQVNSCSAQTGYKCTNKPIDCTGRTKKPSSGGTTLSTLNVIITDSITLKPFAAKYTAVKDSAGTKVNVEDPVSGSASIKPGNNDIIEINIIVPTDQKSVQLTFETEKTRKEFKIEASEVKPETLKSLENTYPDRKFLAGGVKTTTDLEDNFKKLIIEFTVPTSFIKENEDNGGKIGIGKLSNDGKGGIVDLPTKTNYKDNGFTIFEAETTSTSLFVVNAKGIITGPKTCDNDGKCEPPLETIATCPTDCLPTNYKCEEGSLQCVGNTVHKCTSGELLKIETCQMVCIDGRCLDEPPQNINNMVFMALIAVTVIMGLMLAVIFLRK